MKRRARVPAIGLGEPDEAVDEDPPRANLCCFRNERAVGSPQLLLEELPRREHQLQSPVPLELPQVPAEARRIANELIRGYFEQEAHSRLAELPGPTAPEHASRRAHRPARPAPD